MQQEQSLQMNLSQHLVMTMKLQQAIQILQLSSQDLRAEIEKEYLENPTLEIDYGAGETPLREEDRDVSAMIKYLNSGDTSQPSYFTDDEEHESLVAAPADLSLERELLQQAEFAFPEDQQRAIAVFLIGSLDARGYLTTPLTTVAEALRVNIPAVEHVLQILQGFEPSGVGARDLAECLRIQAKAQGIYDGLVAKIIDHYLDFVANNKIKEIAKAENCTPAEVQLAIDIVRKLDPKPGSAYGNESSEYITPDVIVERVDGTYRVTLNDNYIPKVHISSLYQQYDSLDKAAQTYICQRLQSATWLINSIEQRRQTILSVVKELVRVQKDFIEKGPLYLHPLTMQDVAEAVGVHESTVSRAVANKYVQLPNGVVALRKFFSANLGKANGEDFIAGQAKAAIAELIKAEDPHKPLSDQKICILLKAKNMDLSRRTVMKYRESLGFPSSVKRKRY